MQNIEELNLITEKNQSKPNYSLAGKVTSIEVYFDDAGKVLIVGVVDNNYIYWASLTGSEDKEMNANIFEYISRGNIRKAGHLYKAIEEAGLEFEDVKRWVKIRFTRKSEDRTLWITPFEGNVAFSQEKHGGVYFARNIAVYMTWIHRKCSYREAGGAYEKVLDYYLATLNEDDGSSHYYLKVKSLIGVIESEDYLYGSENSQIRRKYIELRKKAENLYNRYMGAVR